MGNSWAKRNKELKMEIVGFLQYQEISGNDLIASCKFIADTAHHCAMAMKDCGNGLEDCEEYLLDDSIARHFKTSMRSQILSFINQKCVLEYEALKFMDKQRWWEKDGSKYPAGEIQILPDKILVVALGCVGLIQQSLPPGGKYRGDGTGKWEYSLSSLGELGKTELPIIKHLGVS